jgi:hypothetical protein
MQALCRYFLVLQLLEIIVRSDLLAAHWLKVGNEFPLSSFGFPFGGG